MKKQILKRGYITNALTDGENYIYGLIGESINFSIESEFNKYYYWSEVYCEPGYMATVIRKGKLLCNKTPELLHKLLKQSTINLK